MRIKIFILLSFVLLYKTNVSAVVAEADSVKSRQLPEIIVEQAKALTKLEADGFVTTIAGTPLQKVGTAIDLMNYIPGVMVSNGVVQVIGRGQPLIYINGRKLHGQSDLNRLSAAGIKSVKVINNPGARYDNTVTSVIRITTVKVYGEGMAMDIKNTVGLRDYFYGKEILGINYRSGGTDLFGSFQYDNNRLKGNSLNTQNVAGAVPFVNKVEMTSKKRFQNISGKIGINHVFSGGHSVGVYYQGGFAPDKENVSVLSSFQTENQNPMESSSSKDIRRRTYNHLIDGYYSGKLGDWSIDFALNLLWRNQTSNQEVMEKRPENVVNSLSMGLRDKSNGKMFATEVHLTKPLWKGAFNTGATYSDSRRRDNFTSSDEIIKGNCDAVNEYNVGVYGELSQRFGRLAVQLGLRYEHIGSDYHENGSKNTPFSRDYNELLPSASVAVPWGKVAFQAGYSRRYIRPLYSQLSSSVFYVNQYIYETGNPSLRSSVSNNFSLNIRYSWLMLMLQYKNIQDRIITQSFPYDNNPDITLLKKTNSPRDINNAEAILSVTPGFIGKYYYPVIMGGIVTQFYKIDYNGGYKNMNRPMAIVRMNNIFRLPGNWMLTGNFNYRSSGDGDNVHLRQSWQLDAGVAKSIDKHWDIKLSIIDCFNSARKNGFIMYDGIRTLTTLRHNNTRTIELNVNYKLNIPKSKYKGKGAGNAEKDRL